MYLWEVQTPILLPSVHSYLLPSVTNLSMIPVVAKESLGSSYPTLGITDLSSFVF